MSEQLSRRRFLGYLVAAPTLTVAVSWTADLIHPEQAKAAVPSPPQPEEILDLGDMQDLAAAPTSGLITVRVNEDGTASFAVPRAEVGQGMTTAIAMMVAEELDLPLGKVTITLADARPELLMNQLTGGSNSMRSMYLPVRTAAAIARQRLVEVAAAKWSADATRLTTKDGVVTGPDGQTASYGELAAAAAAGLGDGPAVSVTAQLKPESDFTILGTPQSRIDAGDWGKAMPSRTAQGIAVHSEYQGAIAVLAEIDCTPATASRPVADGVTGPRVTKVLVVVDAGFAVNPRGLEAQMIGGVQDGIALALTSSLHIADGIPLEGSWDNYFYTREWNTPLDIEVIVMPATSYRPGSRSTTARSASPRCRSNRPRRSRPPTASTAPSRDPRVKDSPSCPRTPSSSTASRPPSTPKTASASSGCSATSWASPAPSTAARSMSARPARATSTAVRSIRARCGSVTSSRPMRSPPSRACRPRCERTCIRCSSPGSTTTS
jgi:hypothetical protein